MSIVMVPEYYQYSTIAILLNPLPFHCTLPLNTESVKGFTFTFLALLLVNHRKKVAMLPVLLPPPGSKRVGVTRHLAEIHLAV